MEKKPKGIGGWLLVFVIFILIRLILAIFATVVVQEFDIFLVIEMVLDIIVLCSILFKWNGAIKISIAYLIIDALLLIVQNSGQIMSSVIEERAYGFGSVVGGVVFSVAWIIYWVKSKRVKNTFRE